jgi:SAM-dependent methyltransferase
VTWVQGDAMTYPFPLALFDAVTRVATIYHLPNLDRTFARLAALTAPGGIVAVGGLRSDQPIVFITGVWVWGLAVGAFPSSRSRSREPSRWCWRAP